MASSKNEIVFYILIIYFETLENLNIVFLYHIEFWKKAGLICHNFCLQIYVHSKVKNVVICQEFSANENSTKEIVLSFFSLHIRIRIIKR